jgi:hypothetical protein
VSNSNSAVPLSVLVSTTTQPQALSTILGIAGFLGLSTTAWQPLGMVRTILATVAQVVANFTSLVSNQAQGGYASLAAIMPGGGSQFVDSQGYLTTWMTLIASQVFNVTRNPATFAQGLLPILNNTGTLQSGGAGTLHAKDLATGATFTNPSAYTIASGPGVTTNVPMVADVAGSNSTVPVMTVLSLTTPISGCAVQPLAADWTGAAAETNAALLVRCVAKLGSLSPNGAAGAYRYIALSIPQAPVASAIPPYAVTQPVTRVGLAMNKATGIVQGYLASASGPSLGVDVAAVNAAWQAFAVPNAQTVRAGAATSAVIPVVITIYVPAAAGLGGLPTIAALNAIAAYFGNTPIGGVSTNIPNQLPRDALISIISLYVAALSPAYAQQMSVQMASPATDVTMLPSDVPVLAPFPQTIIVESFT